MDAHQGKLNSKASRSVLGILDLYFDLALSIRKTMMRFILVHGMYDLLKQTETLFVY